MARNLKPLGLVLAAVLALSATTAATASAQTNGELTTDSTSVALVGKETGGTGSNAFTAFGGKMECPGTTYTGHKVLTAAQTEEGVKHTAIPVGASSITVTPHYVNCTIYSGASVFPSTVDMNGCDYEFHIGETNVSKAETYKIKTTVVCPTAKHIQITYFSSSTHAFRVCTVTITHDPKGYDGLHATDTTNGKIDIAGTIEGIKADRSGLCGTLTDEKAIWHTDVEVEGRNEAGAATDVGISHSPDVTTDGKLTSDGTQVELLGRETGPTGSNAFTAFARKAECPGTIYRGRKILTQEETELGTKHGLLSNGASNVTTTPFYVNCTTYEGANIFPATFDMNGCDYEYHFGETVTGKEDSYEVKATLVCPPGKQIQLTVFTNSAHAFRICTSTITHSPKGYDGLLARDTTNGKIDVDGTIEGIKVDQSGLCGALTDENAVWHTDIEVEGRNGTGGTTAIGLSH